MAKKILLAEKAGKEFRFTIWLDDTKTIIVDDVAVPDPQYVRRWQWNKGSLAITDNAYLTQIRAAIREMANHELANLPAAVVVLSQLTDVEP